MKEYLLKDLVDFQTGLVLTRAGKKVPKGTKADLEDQNFSKGKIQYKYITLRSIDNRGEIDESKCDDFDSKEVLTNRYLTKKEDILIGLFEPLKSCYIQKSQVNYIVPSQFVTVRIKKEVESLLSPEYLYCVIRHKDFENQLLKTKEGFQLKTIKTSDFEKVKISVPDIETQKKIIEVYKLIIEKEKLYNELVEQEKKYNQILLEKLIKGSVK